jgi:hypothetical protein
MFLLYSLNIKLSVKTFFKLSYHFDVVLLIFILFKFWGVFS